MQDDLLAQGIELMLVGMGTVFVFLTALVVATSLMSAVVMRRQPPEAPKTPPGAGPTEEEIAAITVAIDQYRRR